MLQLRKADYTVAWICALPRPEWQASRLMLDEEHDDPSDLGGCTHYSYAFGSVNGHNVVMGCLVDTQPGIGPAASVASAMKTTFGCLKFAILVGIGGGVPSATNDIRLGDVVVSRPDPERNHGGVKQYDFGKAVHDGKFEHKGMLNMPPEILLSALGKVRSAPPWSSKFHEYLDSYKRWKRHKPEFAEPPEVDKLFQPQYRHETKDDSCYRCDLNYEVKRSTRNSEGPQVFFGTIASGNQVMKDALKRDMISRDHNDVLCFEMEAAGLMNVFPCLVIRGICDYCDSHKNDLWQPFAAAVAAAWAKELLRNVTAADVSGGRNIIELYSATPVNMLPYDKDEHFVGREEILNDIERRSTGTMTHCRTAIVGLGGVGKSQIAIEYGWRLLERTNDVSVFWVHASSSERFYNDYQSIATKLQLQGFDDPKKNHLKIVTDWLNSEPSGRWLLIVDNADDKRFTSGYSANLPNTIAFTMPEHLPRKRGCTILLTSRDRQAACDLVRGREHVIDVKEMTEQEAVELFYKKTALRTWDPVQAHRLAIRLECLPLAITQATAYIMQRERMTISTYLERIYCEEERLLMESQNDLRRDPNVPNSVINTWEISFQQIQTQDRSAAELLFKMSFLDRREVPVWLLIEPKSHQAAVDEAIETLLKYSFVNLSSSDGKSLRMHRLVQLAARSWMKSRGELPLWNWKALELLVSAYPDQDYAEWRTCQLLEPHAEAAIELSHSLALPSTLNEGVRSLPASNPIAITEGEMMTLKIKEARGKLLCKRAMYAHGQGHYGRAVNMAELGWKDLVDALTSEDPETLHCGNVLAVSYLQAGRLEDAARVGVEVIERQRSVLGAEHPGTLTTMTNLAVTYRDLGFHDEAMDILLDVVKMYDGTLPDVERTLFMTMNDLAASYGFKGDLVKKEELTTKIVQGFTRIGGAYHPETLTARSNLAQTYRDQGRLDEAEEILNDVVPAKKIVLGDKHPNTISSLVCLASVYYRQSRFMEAYDVQAQAVEISRNLPDENGFETLAHESTLAVMMHGIGHHNEALKLAEYCANMYSIHLGEDHERTESARNLTSYLQHQSVRRPLPSGKELDGVMERLRAILYQNEEAPVPDSFEIDDGVDIEDDIDLIYKANNKNNVDSDSDGEAPVPAAFELGSGTNSPK